MAFTTTQTTDSMLLRQLHFRTPANAPISSLYSLYATGNGQTYWSNAVLPANLSSFSSIQGNLTSSIYQEIQSVSTALVSSFQILSSSISTVGGALVPALTSTVAQLTFVDAQFSNSINGLNLQFGILSNTLTIQVNSIYNSTLQLVNSTLTSTTQSINDGFASTITYVDGQVSTMSTVVYSQLSTAIFRIDSTIIGISSISSFVNEFSRLESTMIAGLSSLSTAITVQNISTYTTLTQNYTQAIQEATVSSTQYTTDVFSTISSLFTPYTVLDNFSTVITNQLLSTSVGLVDYFTQFNAESGLSTVYYSTILPMESTIAGTQYRIFNLEQFSTSFSSITNDYISTFVSTSQGYQNIEFGNSISTVSTTLGFEIERTSQLSTSFSQYASTTSVQLSTQSGSFTYILSSIIDLQYEFSVITTSSILAGIYESFIQLEEYTSNLITSTVNTTYEFQSSLYFSTTVQNQSIATGYFNFYVSTLYTSTLSTLIPTVTEDISSITSSLYAFGYSTLVSSLTSSFVTFTDLFLSTTSSITAQIIFSSGVQFQSSVLGYVSSPTAAALSTFSSLSFISLSTFSGLGSTSLFRQASTFASTFNFYNTNLNIVFISSMGQLSTYTNRASTSLVQTASQLSSFSTQFSVQLSTQNGLFNSTLRTYPSTLNAFAQSTNTLIVNSTVNLVTSTLNYVANSTLSYYNFFVSTFYTSTIGLSSLYTYRNINLNSSNYTALLDFATTRHFYINVYDIVDLPSSLYRITYSSNFLPNTDYKQGTININISTVGLSYSRNGGKIRFDTYTSGLPTTVWRNVYPQICNADYFMQYNYTIVSNIIYTTLNNVYPRLEVRNLQILPTNLNVQSATSLQYLQSFYWRGSPIQISWSNYSFFPFGSLGAPPYDPEVAIEVFDGQNSIEYGPFPFSVSTATIIAPYLRGRMAADNLTTINAYIIGLPQQAAKTTFTTLVPYFTDVNIRNTTQFMGGSELVAITDSGRTPLLGANVSFLNTGSVSSFNNLALYQGSNLINGLLNVTISTGTASTSLINTTTSNVTGTFFENSATRGFADFFVNLGGNYFRNVSTIAALSTSVRFTLFNLTSSYTFTATTISSIGGGSLWEIANPTVPKGFNTFTNTGQGSHFIRYNYSPIPFVSSVGFYQESTFIGPNIGAVPNTLAQMNLTNIVTTTIQDAVSTIIYQNLPTDSIVTPISTANTQMRFTLTLMNGNSYMSTLTTTGAAIQTFQF
jgi:hypothetical protein